MPPRRRRRPLPQPPLKLLLVPSSPVVPKAAVSLGLLQKAKKLAAQVGGIKEAKAAIDALSQLMD